MITSDKPGTWAHSTMSSRIDITIIRKIFSDNADNDKFTPQAKANLEKLSSELQSSSPLRHIEPDDSAWRDILSPLISRQLTYLTAPWLISEFYVYRRVIEAIDYDSSSFDPFLLEKEKGLTSTLPLANELIKKLGETSSSSSSLYMSIAASLWGNKADLSLWGSASSGKTPTSTNVDNLLCDDSGALEAYLLGEARPKTIHIVLDNAGYELCSDLVLANQLLKMDFNVTLHCKSHPTFVSDALTSDVVNTLGRLGDFGQQLLTSSKLSIVDDKFWNLPLRMDKIPLHLFNDFKGNLVIFKVSLAQSPLALMKTSILAMKCTKWLQQTQRLDPRRG